MPARYNFIDHYRGWAVVVMIEVHIVNVWLADTFRQEQWFGLLKQINGLVAPSFLFISGVAFAIIADRKFDSLNRATPEFMRLFRRFAWIWALGYLLHLPSVQWQSWRPYLTARGIESFYQIDVLQVIGLSLLILLLLCRVFRERQRFYMAVVVLSAVALFITPLLWSIDFSKFLHPFIADYLNGLHNPLFPFFPWSVFVWSGLLIGGLFLKQAEQEDPSIAAAEVLGAGIMLLMFAIILSKLSWMSYSNFWLDSPQWVMIRLAIVIVLFCIFWRLESRGITGSAAVLLIGRQSLFAYVFHLICIFWVAVHFLSPRSFGIWTVAGFYAILLALTVLVTRWWVRFRAQKPRITTTPQQKPE